MKKIAQIILVIVISQLSAVIYAQQICFSPPIDFVAGYSPTSITSGDFNGDGFADLAVPNASDISILLGTGTGSFIAAGHYTAGNQPIFVISADFNGDGKADLAVANANSVGVSVLLGTGTGSFGVAANFGYGAIGTQSITCADFNGDGKADLAYVASDGTNLFILLGTGTGSFGSAYFNAGTSIGSIISADFNGDGKADLAVANDFSGDVSVLLGTGTGSFGSAASFTAGNQPCSIISADFNGDGKVDLAVSYLNSSNISVLLGTGTGSFGAATNFFTAGTVIHSVISADFDGDGKADLAVTDSSNNVSILLGTGTGSFVSAQNFTAGNGAYSIASADFNGDGKVDLATGNYSGGNLVSILLNSPPVNVTVSGPTSVCVGNLITLTANGATNYRWIPGGETTSSISFIPSLAAPYAVSGTDGTGCVSTKNIALTVNPLPTITITPQPICGLTSTPLIASGASNCTWSTNQTGASITVNPAVNTNYTVAGTDYNGCVGTSSINIGPNPTANFSYAVNGLVVGFTKLDPTDCASGGFLWDYGNGMTSTSAPAPFVTYATAGTYTACLTCNGLPSGCSVCANITVPGNFTGNTNVTGITENEVNKNITIYPNPFTFQTTISFSEMQKNTSIKIMDVLGKEIKTINFSGTQLLIEKGEMKAGIYFVQLIDENKNIVNRKIVVQ